MTFEIGFTSRGVTKLSLKFRILRHCFGLTSLLFVIGFGKGLATFSTNQLRNEYHARLCHVHFPALGVGDLYLIRNLIGSLGCFRFL